MAAAGGATVRTSCPVSSTVQVAAWSNHNAVTIGEAIRGPRGDVRGAENRAARNQDLSSKYLVIARPRKTGRGDPAEFRWIASSPRVRGTPRNDILETRLGRPASRGPLALVRRDTNHPDRNDLCALIGCPPLLILGPCHLALDTSGGSFSVSGNGLPRLRFQVTSLRFLSTPSFSTRRLAPPPILRFVPSTALWGARVSHPSPALAGSGAKPPV